MNEVQAPVCTQHEAEVSMELASLHSDASRPGLFGLFQCPECGHGRRVPVGSAA